MSHAQTYKREYGELITTHWGIESEMKACSGVMLLMSTKCKWGIGGWSRGQPATSAPWVGAAESGLDGSREDKLVVQKSLVIDSALCSLLEAV